MADSHGLDIALGTQSYNLVFIEVLRFQNRYFVSAFSDQSIKEVKRMLKDVVDENNGTMELYAFYPKANNFIVLKDDSSLSECGFRPDSSNFHQPGIMYLTFGKENPAFTGDPRNKPIS
uniref:PB1 domain-containing protein n=1 Tax=Panagrolaimus sp. ES5 TaxID=591445 RepID=A0AC34F1G7_9BILA